MIFISRILSNYSNRACWETKLFFASGVTQLIVLFNKGWTMRQMCDSRFSRKGKQNSSKFHISVWKVTLNYDYIYRFDRFYIMEYITWKHMLLYWSGDTLNLFAGWLGAGNDLQFEAKELKIHDIDIRGFACGIGCIWRGKAKRGETQDSWKWRVVLNARRRRGSENRQGFS